MFYEWFWCQILTHKKMPVWSEPTLEVANLQHRETRREN